MKNLIVILTVAACFFATDAMAQQEEIYSPPKIGSKFVDWCKSTDLRTCGKPAADAFCKSNEHVSAKNYYKSRASSYDTVYVSNGKRCTNPLSCNYFSRIDCTTKERSKKNEPNPNVIVGSKLPDSIAVNPQITGAIATAFAPSGIKTVNIPRPRINGRRVDFCLSPTGNCGFYTAEAICRDLGHSFATNFKQGRTLRKDTVYQENGNQCLNFVAGCNWIEKLSCGDYIGSPDLSRIRKSERSLLVVVSDLSDGYDDDDEEIIRNLYNFIEFSAEQIARTELESRYKETIVLKDNVATKDFMIQALSRLTSDNATKAVDVVFVTHGTDSRIHFNDVPTDAVSSSDLSNAIVENLSGEQRLKLRALFSTACFGESHINDWLDAGFKTASGATEVYTDSALSFQPMLKAWSDGKTFNQAIVTANKSDHRDIYDSAYDEALSRGAIEGLSSYAGQVDSTRTVKGEGRVRIDSMRTLPVTR